MNFHKWPVKSIEQSFDEFGNWLLNKMFKTVIVLQAFSFYFFFFFSLEGSICGLFKEVPCLAV